MRSIHRSGEPQAAAGTTFEQTAAVDNFLSHFSIRFVRLRNPTRCDRCKALILIDFRIAARCLRILPMWRRQTTMKNTLKRRTLNKHYQLSYRLIMSPPPSPNQRGGGHMIPSALASASALLIVCTLSPEPMGGFWPLTQTHYWEGRRKWLDFGDLDLIFKVTPALWNFQILNKKACLHSISSKWRILAKLHKL